MFAVIQTGGKQINVFCGQEIFIEKITGQINDKIIFDKVLMIDQQFGRPFLENVEVHGEIIKQNKYKKIKVFKYKPKKNYKKMYGHRQQYTKILIIDILINGKSIINKNIEQLKIPFKTKITEKNNLNNQLGNIKQIINNKHLFQNKLI